MAAARTLIANYLERHGLQPASRADGRATVMVDDAYRIHLEPTPAGWLALHARLCPLPGPGHARDQLLQTVGKLATGMMHAHACACAVDPDEEALRLQLMLPPDDGGATIDEAIGQLANALAFWTPVVRRAAQAA